MNTNTEDHKLYSKGENWWHFREDPNSTMGSYSITVIHDGTIVLTGDYGVLAVRWVYFPKDWKQIRLIITDDIHINYFAEKVVKHNSPPKIMHWKEERAIKDIMEYIKDWDLIDDVDEFMESLCFDTQESMYNDLMDKMPTSDWTECDFGIDYTLAFKWQLELFKRWARAVRTKEKPIMEGSD